VHARLSYAQAVGAARILREAQERGLDQPASHSGRSKFASGQVEFITIDSDRLFHFDFIAW
jgi:hypothetical protein